MFGTNQVFCRLPRNVVFDNKQFDDAVCSVVRSVIAKLKESVGSGGDETRF